MVERHKFDAYVIHMTNQNLIDELEKVEDKKKKVLIEDIEDGITACGVPRYIQDQNEDPVCVLQIEKVLPYVYFEEDFDRDAITLTCEQLIQMLKQRDREQFVITGQDVSGRYIQSVREDDGYIILSNKYNT